MKEFLKDYKEVSYKADPNNGEQSPFVLFRYQSKKRMLETLLFKYWEVNIAVDTPLEDIRGVELLRLGGQKDQKFYKWLKEKLNKL